MGTGYIRQSTANIAAGLNIHAADHNAEYNQLAGAFNGSVGHAHDGTTGNGPQLDINGSTTGNLLEARGGVGTGGTALQILAKGSSTDYDTQWVTPYTNGYKNALYNGEFQIQQRGVLGAPIFAVPSNSTTQTFDRWFVYTNGASATYTVGVGGTAGGLGVNSRYCAIVQRNAGQTSVTQPIFAQAIPYYNIRPLWGKVVTLSALFGAGGSFSGVNGTISMALIVGTGTEGKRLGTPYTSETVVCVGSINVVTGSPLNNKLILTGTMPTTATQAQVQITWVPFGTAGASDYATIAEVQLEAGPVATAFERNNYAKDLLRCQRFFWKTFAASYAPVTDLGNQTGAIEFAQIVGGSPLQVVAHVRYPTMMHSTQNPIIYNPWAANNQFRNLITSTDWSVSLPTNQTESCCSFSGISPAGSSIGQTGAFHLTVDAEI
jgi:hypothetical protein